MVREYHERVIQASAFFLHDSSVPRKERNSEIKHTSEAFHPKEQKRSKIPEEERSGEQIKTD
jgi:hypothetical protein